ncbi:MAG: type I methionyl aminopeptidase [Propionibacteriaceae bacterium]|nr:type I methionyl aminopeptidase [Propionibacteriaceae bacterium]
MRPKTPRGIQIKRLDQIEVMRRAGLVVSAGLEAMATAAAPGVTTLELDAVGRDVLASHGAKSSFLRYGAGMGLPPYPAVVCLSVNEEVVHGIPGSRVLRDGDILSIDFGAIVDGWHGDAARTVIVGEAPQKVRDLIEATRLAMWAGIAAVRVGARIGDVSAAIEASVKGHDGRKYGIVREYTGHGIGSAMHQPPDVPNWGHPRRGPRIVQGMALAIEPMLTLGTERVVEGADEWTVSTADGSWAAHWEDTVAVTPDGLWVLTEPDGGAAELASRGVRCGGQCE